MTEYWKHFVLNKAQAKALKRVYDRDPSVAKNYRAFRRTAFASTANGCAMVPWKGMWLGIEEDGYTHS